MSDQVVQSEMNAGNDGGELVSFAPTPDKPGVRLLDRVERRLFEIFTDTPVDPSPTDGDQFLAPVDSAIEIRAGRISYPSVAAVYVRDESGSLVTVAQQEMECDLPADTYVIELNAPIKVYLRVEGPVAIRYEVGRTTIDFGIPRTLSVGARSHHKHPAATVTTTADPLEVMEAISTMGSALKTSSPERSYPTLRGHPPLIELGDKLDIPSEISPPDSGVTIEVPPHLEKVFEVSPLVYYLGATVRQADAPRIITDQGFEHPLDSQHGFRNEVGRTLKQVFFLDCLSRTEGVYTIDLHERRRFEERVDVDFTSLFAQSLEERLERYLEIPFETLSDLLPKWKLTTHLSPEPESVEILPFAMHELALVHAKPDSQRSSSAGKTQPFSGFLTGGDPIEDSRRGSDSPLKSGVEPVATDTLGQAWFREGAPRGASKASIDAYRNRLARSPSDDDVTVAVVRNDPRMDSTEEVGETVYEPRETLPFDLSYHHEVTTAEMRSLLSEDIDFLHYIGHVEEHGFECIDGTLDADSVSDIGVDSFFLNACRSYEQGMALIRGGAVGGVVTLTDVINSEATVVGRTLARLLYQGFPLRPAVAVARRESPVGPQYVVVGDGEVSIAQPESGAAIVSRFESVDGGLEMQMETYPTTQKGMGSMFMPSIGDETLHYLNGGRIGPIRVEKSTIDRILEEEDAAILIDGNLRWSSDLEPADILGI